MWILDALANMKPDPPQTLVFRGRRRIVAPIDVAIFSVSSESGFWLYVTTREMSSPLDGSVVFGLADYPVPAKLKRFLSAPDRSTSPRDLTPEAVLYAGFHDEPRKVDVRIVNVHGKQAEVQLSFQMRDLQYYDDRARPTSVTGRFRAHLGSRDDMTRMPI